MGREEGRKTDDVFKTGTPERLERTYLPYRSERHPEGHRTGTRNRYTAKEMGCDDEDRQLLIDITGKVALSDRDLAPVPSACVETEPVWEGVDVTAAETNNIPTASKVLVALS
uniref:Uncharacterized protein n=1 Tax=Anopheles atroparvus TaxID=41427 RepID=A0A182JB27_ANOAO